MEGSRSPEAEVGTGRDRGYKGSPTDDGDGGKMQTVVMGRVSLSLLSP